MNWKIQYRIKGDNTIKSEIVDISFDTKSEVMKWWLSKKITFVDWVWRTGKLNLRRYNKELLWI